MDIGHWTLDIGSKFYISIYIYYCGNKKNLRIKFLGIFEGQIFRHSVNIFDLTWTLDIGHWTLDIGHWTMDIGPWILIGYWALDIGQWTLDIGYFYIVEIQCRNT